MYPLKSNHLGEQLKSVYPSISKMSQDEIASFKKIDNWVQNRTLFKEPSSWSGGKTEECFNFSNFGVGDSYPSLCGALKNIMNGLTSDDVYMDVGAGDGHAIHQYREIYPEGAKVIGITSTQPANIQRVIEEEKMDEKFSFFLADFKEFQTEPLSGRVSVITDIKGAFRYGLDPAGVIQKMGDLLKEGGLAIISFGGRIGIKPPSLIEEKYIALNSKERDFIGSSMLLHLWFHTIKGFDVIQENMDIEKSRKIHSEVMEKPEKFRKEYFGQETMVIKRNNQPVEADALVPDPAFIKEWSETPDSKKNHDCFCPFYTWKTSGTSETLLSKITWLC